MMSGWWKLLLGLFCGLLAAGLILLVSSPPRGQPISLLPPPTEAPIVVYVAGAVAHPGVYALPPGSRAQDAIQVAGGLLPQANPQLLNLAELLEDGVKVSVPTQYPTPLPASLTPLPGVTQSKAGILYPININTATLEELDSLPEIGPSLAQRIIEYREKNGLFKSIEEIMNVSGIGPSIFEQIKDLITV